MPVMKLNRALRRKLGKPWQGRRMAQDKARRDAAEAIENGTLPVRKKKEKVRGCSEYCGCRSRRVLRPAGAGTGV